MKKHNVIVHIIHAYISFISQNVPWVKGETIFDDCKRREPLNFFEYNWEISM